MALLVGFVCLLFLVEIRPILCLAEEGKHSRFEFRHSIRGPSLINKQNKVPFWTSFGNAIPSTDQVRLVPSIRNQKGGLWSETKTSWQFWEVELEMRVTGTGRMGGSGLALWFTEEEGAPGHVFGAADKWKGLGLFFDSTDDDFQDNNPYILAMVNDGTLTYDAKHDGNSQQIGGCMRDFRNRPFPVRVKVRYYNKKLTIFYHGGMTAKNDGYELCMRADNVELPAAGYFGLSAATGERAMDDHDVIRLITHSLTPPLTEEQKKQAAKEAEQQQKLTDAKREEYEKQYASNVEKLDAQKQEYQKEHAQHQPEGAQERQQQHQKQQEQFESIYERNIWMVYESINAVHKLVTGLHSKAGELTEGVNTLHKAVGDVGTTSSSSVTQQDVNSLFVLQTDVKNALHSMRKGDTGEEATRKLDSVQAKLQELLTRSEQLTRDVTEHRRAEALNRAPQCPQVNCVGSVAFTVFALVQVALVCAYVYVELKRKNAAKKFY